MPGLFRHRKSASLLVFALTLSLSFGVARELPAQSTAALSFSDVSATAGIELNGVLTESMCWGDYDGDGDQDLYLTNQAPNNLFRNDGGDTFTDVTTATGTGNSGWSVGTAFSDLDNDGDLDLYVVNFNSGNDVLYRNDGPIGAGGETSFTDITLAAGTTNQSSSRGMCTIDYDRDGLLDIYVCAIGNNIMYHNDGGLTFSNTSAELSLGNNGQNVGVVNTDIDDNGWPDIFTGNRSFNINSLFMNDSGNFTNTSPENGITNTGLGMGVLSFDFDNDLDFDLYYTSWPSSPNSLYENLDGVNFADIASASGTLDQGGWGISCNIGDVDNDGFSDFFVTNGFDPGSTANVLFRNTGARTFVDETAALGGAAFDGRGVGFADYDNDGDMDICLTSPLKNKLWRNDTVTANHWLTLKLTGVTSNRSAVGARVEVFAGGVSSIHEVSGGAGRGSSNSLPVELGLGSASLVERIIIRWPDGSLSTLDNVAADQILSVSEVDTWTDLGQGLTGSGPLQPRLAGLGSAGAGASIGVALRQAAAAAPVTLVIGATQISASFKGGVLVPSPDVLLALGSTDANGRLELSSTWPVGAAVGLGLWFQAWLPDSAAAVGLAASNALMTTTL